MEVGDDVSAWPAARKGTGETYEWARQGGIAGVTGGRRSDLSISQRRACGMRWADMGEDAPFAVLLGERYPVFDEHARR